MVRKDQVKNRRGPKPIPAEVRFSAKCHKSASGCIEWLGAINSAGYGTFYAGPQRYVMAHRWSYEMSVGAIPRNLHLDHLCKNTRCVNPDHLEPVTAQENLLRGETVPSRNSLKTHCPKGHEYSEGNTYLAPRTNNRQCRTCIHARSLGRSIKNRKA